jgi:hypothetical protein
LVRRRSVDANPGRLEECAREVNSHHDAGHRQFIRELRSLQFFRCQLKGLRDHEGNGKTYRNQHYRQPDCRVWNLEKFKGLRRDLHQ